MAKVLIAGCGYVGTTLGLRLARAGHTVYALRRVVDALPPEFKAMAADLCDLESLRPMPDYFDTVFYTASADGFSALEYRRAYVDGLWNLLEALHVEGRRPQRIIFASSTGVYGQQAGEMVDEDAPVDTSRFTGQYLVEGETLLLNSVFPAVSVRFGGIYGPGRTRFIDRVRDGEARCIEGKISYLNHIHRDDCAGVLEHVMNLADPAPVYVAVDDEPVEKCALKRWIAQQLDLPEPPVVPPGSEPGARQRGGNRRCSNRRLRESGYVFEYPTFREGYANLLHHA